MTLKDIAFKNLLRRKAKAAFMLAGLIVGVATVVAVISFSETMTRDINNKLEKFGANILIVPRTDSLSLTYGGMALRRGIVRPSPDSASRTVKNRNDKKCGKCCRRGPHCSRDDIT